MSVVFRMEYDAVGADLLVFQDERTVSKYSLFSNTHGRDFSEWYKDLPSYCLQEANGDYFIEYWGGQLTAAILKKEFSQDEHCKGFSVRHPLVSVNYRVKLSCDLCQNQAVDIAINCYDGAYGTAFQVVDLPLGKSTHALLGGAIRLTIRSSSEPSVGDDVAIVPSIELADSYARLHEAKGATLIVVPTSGKAHLLTNCAASFVFACDPAEAVQFLQEYVLEFHCWERLRRIAERLQRTYAGSSVKDAQIQAEMLTRHSPYLGLDVPSRIPLGNKAQITITRYPVDFPCILEIDNKTVLDIEKDYSLVPKQEGVATVTLRAREAPWCRSSVSITTYKYIPVSSIRLTVHPNVLTVGEQFAIQRDLIPNNAHNIGEEIVTVSPESLAKRISTYQFKAVSAGKCRIVVSVGSVSAIQYVDIRDRPKSIRLSCSSMQIRLGDNSQVLTASIFPVNALGGQVSFTCSNNSVFECVPNGQRITNGVRVITRDEGVGALTATLLDGNGWALDQATCTIEVTPPKDVLTPNGGLVAAVFSLIAMMFFMGYFVIKVALALVVAFGVVSYRLQSKTNTSLWLAVAIVVLCLLFLFAGGA